jgi:Zn-dependent peptidase ImmA (M78 family)
MASSPSLRELGNRVRARREEAGLDLPALAHRAGIQPHALDAFEGGHGGLGLPSLMRVANVLGVPAASFVHTSAPVVRAPMEPSVVLKKSGGAWLDDADRDVLAAALRRARAFTEVGEILGRERLLSSLRASSPPSNRPFLNGYEVANHVRNLIPERDGTLRALARLLEDRFDILVLRHAFKDSRIVGAACRSGNARVVAVNTVGTETARRFALAHELGHHALDLEENGATADEERSGENSWFDTTPCEKRANAFAAMLLAPASVVAGLIGPTRVKPGYEEAKGLVAKVRAYAGMGFAATAWHLHNLHYFDDGMARMLLLAESDAGSVETFEDDTGYDGLHRRAFEALSKGLISRGRARELLGVELDEFDLAS